MNTKPVIVSVSDGKTLASQSLVGRVVNGKVRVSAEELAKVYDKVVGEKKTLIINE